jgi:hypothetical protein
LDLGVVWTRIPEREPENHHCEPHRPEPLILTLGDLELLELILTADEFELIQRSEQGQLPCPDCEQPLGWVAMIAEEYEGLALVCLSCGRCEY